MPPVPPVRRGRPPIGDHPRHLIALRLDPDILAALRAEARRRGIGYQTLIHDILRATIATFDDQHTAAKTGRAGH